MSPSLIREGMSNLPIPLVASFLAFVDQYGSAIMFAVGLTYAVAQFYWRRREHKKIMGDK